MIHLLRRRLSLTVNGEQNLAHNGVKVYVFRPETRPKTGSSVKINILLYVFFIANLSSAH